MSKSVRPSIIMQRSVSLIGGPRQKVQRYSSIDATTVARPVGIGAVHVHAAAVALQNARVITTVSVLDGIVVDDESVRPNSLRWQRHAWIKSLLNGEF